MSFADIQTGDAGGDWREEYRRCRETVIGLRATPTEDLTAAVRAVEALDSSVRRAEQNPKAAKLTEGELVRRRELVIALRRQIEEARNHAKLESLARAGKDGGGGDGGQDVLPPGTSPHSQAGTRSLLQAQAKEIINEQDLILEDIEKGVSRLKDKALAIKDETSAQIKTLDRLDLGVDTTETAVRANTEKAHGVRKASVSWHLYICIIVLFVILLVLIIISFGS